MKTKYLIIVLLIEMILFAEISSAQITFQKTFGGTGSDAGTGVQQTNDGGYIITGSIANFGAGNSDAFLIKTNAIGDTLWTKTYGGTSDDGGRAVQQTTDGGYVIIGYSSSFNNIYLLKTTGNGNISWSKTYSGSGTAEGQSVIQTSDGGYFISGDGNDINLIKTDSNGDTLWTRVYGGTGSCRAYSVQETNDGGYIINGYAQGSTTGTDYYLLKINAFGDSLWTRTYGGISSEQGRSVKQTNDGGYIIAGKTFASFGVGSDDVYLIRTDSIGNVLWSKTFGGTNDDRAYDVEQTNDGGFIIAGETESFGAGSIDVYLLKTDSNGTLMWSKTYGGSDWDAARSIQQTTDGGYIINGFSASFNAGDFDIYLIKTDANGNSGCNLGNPTTISDTAATITGSTGFSFSSGCLVTSPSTITSSGFPFTPLCFNTSVNEISTAISLHIYPNPFTNEFIINGTEEKGDATLYDIKGKEIMRQKTIEGKTIFKTNGLQPGFYLLNYLKENRTANIKLVKF